MTEYVYTLKASLYHQSRTRPVSARTVTVVTHTAQKAFDEAERVLPQMPHGYEWRYVVQDATDLRVYRQTTGAAK